MTIKPEQHDFYFAGQIDGKHYLSSITDEKRERHRETGGERGEKERKGKGEKEREKKHCSRA